MTTPKQIIPPAQLGVAAATFYTTPGSTKCQIKKLTLTNTTAVAVSATVYLIASGGTAGDANTVRKTRNIGPLDVYEVYEAENHTLEAGGFIQLLASAAASVTAIGSGIEIV